VEFSLYDDLAERHDRHNATNPWNELYDARRSSIWRETSRGSTSWTWADDCTRFLYFRAVNG
jgi:hypothetical protein